VNIKKVFYYNKILNLRYYRGANLSRSVCLHKLNCVILSSVERCILFKLVNVEVEHRPFYLIIHPFIYQYIVLFYSLK